MWRCFPGLLNLLWTFHFSFSPTFSSDVESCVFEFPTLSNKNVVTARENTTITLPFGLQDASCVKEDFRVMVQFSSTDYFDGSDCYITVQNGKCVTRGPECVCLQERGRFLFRKTVDRNHNDTLEFDIRSLQSWRGSSAEVTFNILYPASIHTVLAARYNHSDKEVLDQNLSVDVVCLWDPGNPPVTARLLDRHGMQMEGSSYTINQSRRSRYSPGKTFGQMRYTFRAVGCKDAGLISCEAPGASDNKSVKLLVKCAPEFPSDTNVTHVCVVTGEDTQVDFPVRTHTTHITDCQLVRMTSDDGDTERAGKSFLTRTVGVRVNCMGFVHLTGTPPDLTLTVRLDNVRKEEEGQWRLELTNDAGTGHVGFLLTATEPVKASEEKVGAPEFPTDTNVTHVCVVTGEDTQVDFPVRTHTTHITDCQLVRMASHTSDSDNSKRAEESFLTRTVGVRVNCMGFVHLSGTPPDLTLTVRLDNVRKEEEGQWRLELTNDAGTGFVDFLLNATEPLQASNEEEEVVFSTEGPIMTKVAVTVPSVAFIVIVIILIRICVRKGRRGLKVSMRRRQERTSERTNRRSTVSVQSVHLYNEVAEDIPDMILDEPGSDGYLTPAPTEKVAEDAKSSDGASSLCENDPADSTERAGSPVSETATDSPTDAEASAAPDYENYPPRPMDLSGSP